MAEFFDKRGRRWTLKFDRRAIREIRESWPEMIGMKLHKVAKILARDQVKLVGWIWACCAAEAEADCVSPESFAECLTGNALAAATDALISELKRTHERK